jgi:hypothetical protein
MRKIIREFQKFNHAMTEASRQLKPMAVGDLYTIGDMIDVAPSWYHKIPLIGKKLYRDKLIIKYRECHQNNPVSPYYIPDPNGGKK